MPNAMKRLEQSIAQATHQEENYDLAAVREMTTEERAVAVGKLVAMARDERDWRALMTLARVGDVATDALARTLSAEPNPLGFWARRALVERGLWAEARAGLIADTRDRSPFIRFGAMMELGKQQDDDAAEALLASLDDPSDLVRQRAFEALLEQHGLAGELSLPGGGQNLLSPFSVIQLLLGSDQPALRRLGQDQAIAAFRALRGGARIDALGLRYVDADGEVFRKRFGAALRDKSAALPLDEVTATGAQNRRWAEALLAYNLPNGAQDDRLPRALGELRAAWTLPVIEEIAASLPAADAYRTALLAARDRLRSN